MAESAFYDLSSLRILRFDNNFLTSTSGLQNLTTLQVLCLNGNKLTVIDQFAFKSCVNLETLRLENNRITSIHKRSFESLVKLRILRLENNKLTSIETPTFQYLISLETLYFFDNNLATIDETAFSNMEKLEILRLTGNELVTLGEQTFLPLQSLRNLQLHSNQLTNLGGNTFQSLTKLEVLTLYNNLLICNCNLHPFVKWLNQTKSKVIGAVCNGTTISVMDFPYSKCYDEGVNATEITNIFQSSDDGNIGVVLLSVIMAGCVLFIVAVCLCIKCRTSRKDMFDHSELTTSKSLPENDRSLSRTQSKSVPDG
ncbi:leucine-rich repeat transmembrane neuronal protein 4-like [Mytilus californianus]|uniref:leucine-rich repeat transmembrane neuronal protein 4-like n=1 Tax=Mytilus californianus TaxID=6549 RepID=UPI0022483DD6|nr:leucine-rich repeat transmembrane neuronal protein 4-like [Mytilus californianus]